MAKQSLGRDLGALMARNPKGEATPVSAGVRSLMRGHNPLAPARPAEIITAEAPKAVPIAPPTPKIMIPRWYLFAGDVLLVTLALLTVFKSPHPLSWQREFFCAVLAMLAAILGVVALLMPDGEEPNLPRKP
jgi:hypothetical protein